MAAKKGKFRKRTELEKTYNALGVFEELFDKLKQGKNRVEFSSTSNTMEALEVAVRVLQDRLVNQYKVSESAKEFRRPNVTKETLRKRDIIDRRDGPILEQIKIHLEDIGRL